MEESQRRSGQSKSVRIAVRRRVFSGSLPPQGTCEMLVNALKLLANQQRDGGSPVNMVVQGRFRDKSAQDNG